MYLEALCWCGVLGKFSLYLPNVDSSHREFSWLLYFWTYCFGAFHFQNHFKMHASYFGFLLWFFFLSLLWNILQVKEGSLFNADNKLVGFISILKIITYMTNAMVTFNFCKIYCWITKITLFCLHFFSSVCLKGDLSPSLPGTCSLLWRIILIS